MPPLFADGEISTLLKQALCTGSSPPPFKNPAHAPADTKKIKFGSERGEVGKSFPGKRIKAARVI